MSWFEAVVLALVQGLTEFLPISSSAHLILPSQVLGWDDQGLAFDVAVHVGTLLAIAIYFRQEVIQLTSAWLRSVSRRTQSAEQKQDSRLAWLIIVSTIPAGLSGFLFNDFISENLRSTAVIAATTLIFGVALYISDQYGRRTLSIRDININAAIIIGLSQALALIPGTSRSGITMTAALLIGYSRDAAARYSFLLSIPLIAAAGLLKGKELMETGSDNDWFLVILGTVVAFLSAYTCIHWFLRLLDKIGFTPFVIYRLLLGTVLLALMAFSG
jgi:undecaprenyl-diphosphatase